MESTTLMLIFTCVMAVLAGLLIYIFIKGRKNAVTRSIKSADPATKQPYDKVENVQQSAGIGSVTANSSTSKASLLLPDKSEIFLSGSVKSLGRSDFEKVISPSTLNLISRQHFFIKNENGKYYIDDYSSSNGTKVNGIDIKGKGWLELGDGDKIDIAGVVILTFYFNKVNYQNENMMDKNYVISGDEEAYKISDKGEKEIVIPVRSFLKKRNEKRIVSPLMHGIIMNFILCEEGIYIMDLSRRIRWRAYEFYSWQSLSIQLINEKNRLIGLRCGNIFLKIQSRIGSQGKYDNFNMMKNIILDHIPESRRTPVKLNGFRWGVLAISLAVLIVVQILSSLIFENISTGKVGDNLDDITDAGLDSRSSILIKNSDGKLIHEYADVQGAVFFIIHPFFAFNALSSVIHQQGGIGKTWKAFQDNSFIRPNSMQVILDWIWMAYVWFCVLFIIFYFSRSRWSGSAKLRQ